MSNNFFERKDAEIGQWKLENTTELNKAIIQSNLVGYIDPIFPFSSIRVNVPSSPVKSLIMAIKNRILNECIH